MKIVLDGRLISNHDTGISRYSYALTEMYIKKFGHDAVTVIVNKNIKDRPFQYVETELLPFKIKDFLVFHHFLNQLQGDVIHSFFYSNCIQRPNFNHIIITVHDLMYRIVPNFFTSKKFISTIGRLKYDFIVKKSLLNSDHIVTVSQQTARDLLAFTQKKVTVLKEGIFNNTNLKKIDNTEKIPKLDPNSFFLYAGNSRLHKNLPFLIKAFNTAKTRRKLVMVGHDPLPIPNSEKICFFGKVSNNDLDYLYQNCTAFIMPSLYEGFGLPVLEALCAGTKVISSNGGALQEFPKDLLLFFNPRDLQSLVNGIENIDNFELPENLRLKYLEYYSLDSCYRDFSAFMDSIV